MQFSNTTAFDLSYAETQVGHRRSHATRGRLDLTHSRAFRLWRNCLSSQPRTRRSKATAKKKTARRWGLSQVGQDAGAAQRRRGSHLGPLLDELPHFAPHLGTMLAHRAVLLPTLPLALPSLTALAALDEPSLQAPRRHGTASPTASPRGTMPTPSRCPCFAPCLAAGRASGSILIESSAGHPSTEGRVSGRKWPRPRRDAWGRRRRARLARHRRAPLWCSQIRNLHAAPF